MIRAAFLALTSLLVACGGSTTTTTPPNPEPAPGPVTPNGGDLQFTPSKIDVHRYAATCGTSNPPIQPTDSLSMDIVGDTTKGAPYPMMAVHLRSLGAAVGTPIALALSPWKPLTGPVVQQEDAGSGVPLTIIDTNDELAQTADNDVQFRFERGIDQTTLDANAYDAATLTIEALPQNDGDPFTVRIQLHFTDGHTFDATYSGPVPPVGANPCAAG